MFGFVYIWFDCKHKKFYIGSHLGSIDDRYICSSKWMLKAFRKRPQDFRRKIINTIQSDYSDLLLEEQRWLDMIPDEELGKRYYNLKKSAAGGNGGARKGTKNSVPFSQEHRDNLSSILKGRNLCPMTLEERQVVGRMGKGRKLRPRSLIHKENLSRSLSGRQVSEEVKQKISKSSLGKSKPSINYLKAALNRPKFECDCCGKYYARPQLVRHERVCL
jgi:hypothetical protein